MATNNKRRRQRRTRQRVKRPIRVVAVRRKEIDPDQIAMVYWLMAHRRAKDEQEKEQHRGRVGVKSTSSATNQVVGSSDPVLAEPEAAAYTGQYMSSNDHTNDTNYHGVLLEDIQRQVARLSEAMADVPAKVTRIDERLARVESDVTTVKVVVTDQSKVLDEHQAEISRLRAAA